PRENQTGHAQSSLFECKTPGKRALHLCVLRSTFVPQKNNPRRWLNAARVTGTTRASFNAELADHPCLPLLRLLQWSARLCVVSLAGAHRRPAHYPSTHG